MDRQRQNANLKPFPKGVSGNPAGRPKARIGAAKVRDLIDRLGAMPRAKLDQLVADPKATAFEQLFGAVILRAIKDGDYARMSALLDRLIGRAGPSVETEDDQAERSDLKVFSTEELIKLVKATTPGQGEP